jgi:hypothetical protein
MRWSQAWMLLAMVTLQEASAAKTCNTVEQLAGVAQ